MKGSEGAGNSRVLIRVGDVEIDISGSQKEVDAQMMNIRDGEDWSTAIARVRSVRETAIAAAIEVLWPEPVQQNIARSQSSWRFSGRWWNESTRWPHKSY